MAEAALVVGSGARHAAPVSEAVHEAAAKLRKAEEAGVPIPPLRGSLPEGSVEAAYEVQQVNVSHWLADGRRLVGRKIGLTSEAVQRQMGVDQPDFGALFADMCLADGEPIPAGAVLQARAEAEVALVVNRDLPNADMTFGELTAAIDHLLPAIEVVGSRIQDWDISIVDTIADNASSGMYVLGANAVDPRSIDLYAAGMVLELGGRIRSVGSGAACLGHPYRAALWLARRMAAEGEPLRAGDLVLTGALGPIVPLEPGLPVQATIQGLGTVRTILEVAR
ncbi:MAG: 2-keto-4-pentenoate hydratase [Actinomycetia bacterium]|nr:2-keto-4-pentenoate hydratase [Actinomycetes bacterium]